MTRLATPPHRRTVREIETVQLLLEQGRNLRNLAIQNLDLSSLAVVWNELDVADTLFLGCTFPPGAGEVLQRNGAILFPKFSNRPYDQERPPLSGPAGWALFTSPGDGERRPVPCPAAAPLA